MKKVLLDTHALLWFFEGDERLPGHVRSLIEDANNFIYVSIVSFWEIAIKKSIGKLAITNTIIDLFKECEVQDILVVPISLTDIEDVENLPLHHRDPFDRILISTARNNGWDVISVDEQFDAYPVNRIW